MSLRTFRLRAPTTPATSPTEPFGFGASSGGRPAGADLAPGVDVPERHLPLAFEAPEHLGRRVVAALGVGDGQREHAPAAREERALGVDADEDLARSEREADVPRQRPGSRPHSVST